jgi:hypothetical protein
VAAVLPDQLEQHQETVAPSKVSLLNPYYRLGENQIRLAVIKEAVYHHDDVVCCLRTVSQDSAPPYRVLSYCWGARQELGKGSIFLEGETQMVKWPVTPTLEMALRSLRNTDGSTPLLIWADALCINQEKHLVYQNAAEVSIWLGPEDDHSLIAWKLRKDIADCEGDIAKIKGLIEPKREAQFRALNALLTRDYFWRIWVVQEIASARKAIVCCGSESMSWSSLLDIGNVLEKVRESLRDIVYEDQLAAHFTFMSGGPTILKLTTSSIAPFLDTKAPALSNLLSTHMSKGSTDPRDKVYGLVGISSDRPSFGRIDYERSPRARFIYTARHIIVKTQKLNIICLQQNDDNQYHLPSWVPDWERRNLYPKHRVKPLHIREPPFRASLAATAKAIFAEDGEVLIARDFLVDTITKVAQSLYLEGPKREVTPALKAFHQWWTVFANNIGIESFDVFQRKSCGGAWGPHYSDFEYDPSQRFAFFVSLIQKLLPGLLKDGTPIPGLHRDEKTASEVLEARAYAVVSSAALQMHAKRFIISRTKLAGLAPQAADDGDQIVILLGCDFPVVMRNMGSYWTLIGEIYVDEIMYGEAMDGLVSGKYTEAVFKIR